MKWKPTTFGERSRFEAERGEYLHDQKRDREAEQAPAEKCRDARTLMYAPITDPLELYDKAIDQEPIYIEDNRTVRHANNWKILNSSFAEIVENMRDRFYLKYVP